MIHVNNCTNKVGVHGFKGRHCFADSPQARNVCGMLLHFISNVGQILFWKFFCFVPMKAIHPSFLPTKENNNNKKMIETYSATPPYDHIIIVTLIFCPSKTSIQG